PFAACVAVGTVGNDGGVFLRYAYLVVKAIGHPGAYLIRAQPALVHFHVEGMMNMVAGAFGAQLRFELLAIPGGVLGQAQRLCGCIHRFISIPSKAVSMPWFFSIEASCESSFSMGLLLLMWMRILRRVPSASSAAIMPLGPDCGRWPMSDAVFRDSPSRIISSSVHNVPSTSTQSAMRMASSTCGSISASPGA